MNFIYQKQYFPENFRVLYNICGIKIRKVDTRAIVRELKSLQALNKNNDFIQTIWNTHGATQPLIEYFDFANGSIFAWQTYNHHFWLTYISCLIEKNDMQKARKILDKYLLFNNGDLKDIERFMLVAKLADSLGITSENIKKSVAVYDRFQESRKNDIFKKLIVNKKIAIVGNSPSEIGKNKGDEIDSADLVIRMNNYQTSQYAKDYGSKTDIWARNGGAADILDRDEKYKMVFWVADYKHCQIHFNHLDILYRQITNGQEIYCLDSTKNLVDIGDIEYPTIGLTLILEVFLKLGSFDNVNFYGFDFLKEKPDGWASHYFDRKNVKESDKKWYSWYHNYPKEAEFLQKFIKENTHKSN